MTNCLTNFRPSSRECFGPPFAYQMKLNLRKCSIRRPGLADAGSGALRRQSSLLFCSLRLATTPPEHAASLGWMLGLETDAAKRGIPALN